MTEFGLPGGQGRRSGHRGAGLFYDFRELTPIGRRGDEMIAGGSPTGWCRSIYAAGGGTPAASGRSSSARRCARAGGDARLAVIYLMNRRADRALAVLRSTRMADLSNEMRNQRLLLEGRAVGDRPSRRRARSGRQPHRPRGHQAALGYPVAARRAGARRPTDGAVIRRPLAGVRAARRCRASRYLRTAIGYALGEDALGLGRFRERYAGKMGDGPDRRAFDVVTAPVGKRRCRVRRHCPRHGVGGHARRLPARYARAIPDRRAADLATAVPGGTAAHRSRRPIRGPFRRPTGTTGTVRPSPAPARPPHRGGD